MSHFGQRRQVEPQTVALPDRQALPFSRDARRVIFIGDGRSDICPARNADIVFAKTGLLSYLRDAGIPCLAYDDLAVVVAALEKCLHENKI